jgi:hypothetical protein
MGLYGGTKVNYTPPPPDDTFSKYLSYQQAREKTLDDRAAQEKAEAAAEKSARKASGASGYAGVKATTQQQLAQGLIGYEAAANQLRDYSAKYELNAPDWGAYLNKYSDLKNTFGSDTAAAAKHYEQFGKAEGRELSPFAPVEQDITALTQQYTAALPGKRATGMSAAYEELLGRQATAEELSKGQERFQQGYYGSMEDFKDSLSKSPEYKDKFESSYLENYYKTQFGSQVVDEKGKKTGTYKFKFDSKLLPTYGGNLADRTKITTPDFGDEFVGTAEELQAQQQNVRDTRQYLYSAGLTNLQGEIDTNIQKLKKESAKEVAAIGSTGNVYSSLVSNFWS